MTIWDCQMSQAAVKILDFISAAEVKLRLQILSLAKFKDGLPSYLKCNSILSSHVTKKIYTWSKTRA